VSIGKSSLWECLNRIGIGLGILSSTVLFKCSLLNIQAHGLGLNFYLANLIAISFVLAFLTSG